jgi:IS5 family transposase
VIGHMKTDGHLGRCHLKGREGDAANVTIRRQSALSQARASRRLWPMLALVQAFATRSALRSAS